MAIILDILIVLLVAFVVWRSAKKGFVHTVIMLAGYALTIVLISTCPAPVADLIYENTMSEKIRTSISEGVEESFTAEESLETINEIWAEIPPFITNVAAQNGYTQEYISETVLSVEKDGSEEIAVAVEGNVIKPVIELILQAVIAILIFVLCMIVLRIIAKLLCRRIHVPILGGINSILGGALGFIKGVVLAFVIVTILGALLPMFSDKIGFITPEVIEDTYLFRFLYQWNPLLSK